MISHTPERSSDEPTTNVAFFHYSQLDKSKPQTSDGAFRAIAEQLVHTNRGNRLTLDALSLILSEKGSGQKTASGKDIREVLDILLKQHPVFIIIDGVDECMETETLLEQVRSLCLEHDCRFILIGRPDVRIPVRWEAYGSDNTWKVQLTHSLVNDDIGEYLKNGLQLLTLRGAFGRNIRTTDDLKATVNFDLFRTLANAAEGIFLWARLLLNLMNSPALTPAFRLEMLKCPAELVSLDVLYQKILDTLGEADGNEQRTAKNILQWLTFSAIPLSLTTLHTALAINVGRPTTELDYLTDYPDCIPRVTFSLVEVHILQNKASLIHLSFKEFLMSGRANNNNRPITTTLGKMAHMDTGSRGRHLNSYMSSSTNHLRTQQSYASRRGRLDDVVEENMGPRLGTNMTHYAHMSTPIVSQGFTWDSTLNIQLHLAAVCLSYLIHDVPPRPLQKLRRSQSSHRFNIQAASNTLEASAEDVERLEDGPSIDTIVTQFPFLRYSALCWYHHLSIEHHLHGSPFEISSILFGGHESSVAWIPLLAQFLVSRATVTTWVESAYMFRLAPRLDHLIPLLRYLDLDTRPMNAEAREKYWIILGVRQLAGALYHLYERHSQMLFENPTLIWQQDIEKAEDPSFWPVWQEEPDIRIALPPSPFYQDAPMRGDQNVLPTAH